MFSDIHIYIYIYIICLLHTYRERDPGEDAYGQFAKARSGEMGTAPFITITMIRH